MSHSLLLKQILASLLLIISSISYGQDSFWGIRAGANFDKVNNTDVSNSMHLGYSGGLFINFVINDRISFQHELCYASRGMTGTIPGGHTINVNLNYIDVPWMINYNISKALFVQGGIQASVYTFFKSPQYDSIPYNKYNASVFDFSFLVGAGVILDNNMIMGVRLNQSLSPTFNISNPGGKVLNLQVYVAYAINRSVKKGHGRRSFGGGSGYR
jgi:hypothetical protein